MIYKNSQKRYYLENAIYFVTTKTYNNYPYFKNQVLSRYLIEVINMGCQYKECKLWGFVIIPDHIHIIIQPKGKYTISDFIHFIKRHSSRNIKILISKNLVGEDGHPRLRGHGIWQASFHDHIIRDEDDYAAHIDYLRYNPVKHSLVADGHSYPYLFITPSRA